MKSTTSSKSKFFAVFKNQFMRALPSAIALTVFSSIFSIGTLQLRSVVDIMSDGANYPDKYDMTGSFSSIFAMTALYSIVFTCITVLVSVKEMYSKRGSDFFFAVPVKRSTYLNAAYVNAAVSSAIAFAAQAVIIAVFMAANAKYPLTVDFQSLFGMLATLIAIVLSAMSYFVFCASISGKTSQYVLFSIMPIWIGLLFASCAYSVNFIWGFWCDIGYAGAFISPFGALLCLLRTEEVGFNLFVFALSAVQAVVFFVLAQLLFKKRKSEVAEATVSGLAFPLIMLALCQAAIIMLTTLIGYENLKVTAIISIVFALVGTLALAMKWFRKSHRRYAFISLGVVVALCCSFIYATKSIEPKKYVNYVPEASEVEKIDIIEGNNYNMDGVLMQYLEENYRIEEHLEFTSEEAIGTIVNLHKKAVSDEVKAAAQDSENMWATWNVKIIYTLKDGRKVTRAYTLPYSEIREECAAFKRTKDYIVMNEPFDVKNEDILFVSYYSYSGASEDIPEEYYTFDDYSVLKEAILKDCLSDSNEDYFERNMDAPYNPYNETQDVDTEFTALGNISIFSVEDYAPDDVRERLHSMTPNQLMDYYMGVDNYKMPEFGYIRTTNFSVLEKDENIRELFRNATPVK